MPNIEDYIKIIRETLDRTIWKTVELRKKFPNEIFPSEEEIRNYTDFELLNYHLKISERYHQIIIEEVEQKHEYTREDVMD